MLGQRLQNLWKTAFIACALFVAPTVVRAADVSDEAGFFSAAAIEKANTAIKEIEKKSGHDVRIETHATVPKDQVDAVAKMDHGERQKFMDHWVHERAKAVKETGSLILICKDPARVETWFSGRLAERGMTKEDRKRVIDSAISGMKSKDYDAALGDTVTKLGDVYSKLSPASKLRSDSGHRESLPAATSSTPPHQGGPLHQRGANGAAMPVRQANSMGWVFVVGIVIAAIFAIRLLSGLFGGRASGYPQGPGQPGMGGYPPGGYPPPGGGYGPAGYGGGGGGGGFMKSVAGGLFGAVAGNWLYNSFGGNSAHAHGPTSDDSDPLSGSRTLGGGDQSSGNGGWTDDGSSSGGGWFDNGDSGGGGDFGDSGGGGDFGGGGDSGGDSGGGDF